jgi:hypothetical protein
VIEIIGLVGKWIVDLVSTGLSHDDAVEVIKRDIESRRVQIAADRAKIDDAFKRKHGEDL